MVLEISISTLYDYQLLPWLSFTGLPPDRSYQLRLVPGFGMTLSHSLCHARTVPQPWGVLRFRPRVELELNPTQAPIMPLHCTCILADRTHTRKYLGVTQPPGSVHANGLHLPLAHHDHRARLRLSTISCASSIRLFLPDTHHRVRVPPRLHAIR